MSYDNLTLHTDKYQINMMYAHWKNGTDSHQAVFEAFFRKLPFGNGYAVFAGLERIINYINHLQFDEETIRYLQEQEEEYDPAFLEKLRGFRFTGNISAVPEGTIVFANEPLIRVEGKIFEAQLVETALLNFMNFQTLIATKASRIRQVAPEDTLMEFGTRRAQEADAAIWGHGLLTLPALMRLRICGEGCCSEFLPKVRMLMRGYRTMIRRKRLFAIMPLRCRIR